MNTTSNTGPNTLLVKAVRFIPQFGSALDLGMGNGRDSRFLINLGFKSVVAIDKTQPEFIPSSKDFTLIKQNLEMPNWANDLKFDLINIQFVLPFIKNVSNLIQEIHKSLNDKGIFVGQFFSTEDASCKNHEVTCNTLDQVEELLKEFNPISISVESRFPIDPTAHYKTWHTIDFIVSK